MKPTCRGCHAIIRWIRTRAGKAMPVDPEPLTEWVTDEPGLPRISLCAAGGEMQQGRLATVITPGARQIEGFVPHWAACPAREQFKTKREPPVVIPKSDPRPDPRPRR